MFRSRIINADALTALRVLEADSVDCIVTSPPYYALRAYSSGAGELGTERTPMEYIANLVEILREARRILKPTGTAWVNIGDTYVSPMRSTPKDTWKPALQDRSAGTPSARTVKKGTGNLPAKNLMLIPERLAIALQDDGWIVRAHLVWGKTNPMPESVRDRPSRAHEEIYMLTEGPTYFYDAEETSAPLAESMVSRNPETLTDDPIKYGDDSFLPNGKEPPRLNSTKAGRIEGTARIVEKGTRRLRDYEEIYLLTATGEYYYDENGTRLPIVESTAKAVDTARVKIEEGVEHGDQKYEGMGIYPDSSQAMRRIKIGRDDGMRKLRDHETGEPAEVEVWSMATAAYKGWHFATFPKELVKRCLTAGCPTGGVVLDPFGGAGTTGLVARQMGLSSILVELNPEYCDIARRRIYEATPLFGDVAVETIEEAA